MPADFDPSLEPTKNIGAFKFWCQTTLPAVYDESLSYYELLCKVVATLNEVITNNNAQNENVDALHTAYQQLQTYVNNYFTNLDVQDEINNKLDDMARNGTLATLIAGVIGSVTPIFVDSTTNMTNTTKIYVLTTNGHIYAYNGSTFFDTGLIYNSDGNNTILTEYEATISDSWFSSNPTTKIESLPINYIYRVYLNATNGLAFGLPQEFLDDTGANNFTGTLYIFQPFDRANISTQQYRNYIFTGGGNSNVSSWQALDYESSTAEHNWFRLSNNFNVVNYNNKAINNTNLDNRTVLTLKPNNAFNFSLSAENTRNFGIPYTGTEQCSGQVIVSQVYSKYNEVQDLPYRVLTAIYGFGQANTNISFALMFGDSTIQQINWMTVATDKNLNDLKEIALTSHESLLNASSIGTILDLEPNNIYALMVGDDNPEQYGLPADCAGTGTLIIMRGLTASSKSYTTYIYICDDGFTRMYYALLYNYATSISDIHWQNVFATNNTTYRNLGTSTNNIYLLGDSIVEGYGGTGYNGGAEGTSGELITNSIKTWYRNTAGTCWANEYKSYIEENYPNTTVTNNGIGGLTSAQLLSTIDDLYTANSIVIVGIGTNDRNNSNSNGVRTYNNIRHIIKNLMLNDCTPIILTNTPVLPNESSKGKPNIITQAIKSAADKYNVLCVDVMTEFLSYIDQNELDINNYYADYLHPNDAGYKLMFNIIRAKIGL